MQITRAIEQRFFNKIQAGKVIILLGARRVGKSAFLNIIKTKIKEPILSLNGDDHLSHALLEIQSTSNYMRMLGKTRFLIIDEAQEIPNIGQKLKLMVDTIPELKIVITGSSAFEINNQIGEPLVGRMKTMQLYPLAQLEFAKYENAVQTKGNLEERLIYGGYPELTKLPSLKDKEDYLNEIIHSYLLKDILAFEGIKKRDKITALLQKLAFRIGQEISLEGLGKELQISKNTVEKYLDLFSKVFIVYSVSGFSQNRDNEITKMKKWYFMDNGIRNAITQNFNLLSLREDVGKLWENYLNAERIKKLHYQEQKVDNYFWRTHTKQEIDRIEITKQEIQAYEYKWAPHKFKVPTEFAAAYPDSKYNVIDQENYLDYIL
jgi:predicted AAA+ superfamily ATPase